MDPIVEAALKKWPHVPHCYGWLALDARGDWYMRDERIQAAGPFPKVKGSRVTHEKLREFIQRNYAHDERGCWFFQNGPQRVYLQLEAAPWIWRLDEQLLQDGTLRSHTGLATVALASYLDEQDRLFIASELGLGLVHSLDMLWAAEAVQQGRLAPESRLFTELLSEFQIVLQPVAPGA
ncbi:hypothetical protein HNP55_001898 [Paucibacter oligotrophus]|uniref:DUF2946 family protein n=1 Tax=Roseateles oligotrophus TaxID=1769250 RepID=A0A840LB89_9BURK|nr:DUF2946 family protein [Roseateles oligotrophus]MBB4843379.1 hypothetical protein [Roseateles oligotrophus]